MKLEDSISSTLRVVSLLSCFSPEQSELSATEITNQTGISMTTTYRILAGLAKGRLIERNIETGKYRIGTELYFLGSLYLGTHDVVKTAAPVIKTLNDLTSECVFVGIFEKSNVVLVLKEESKYAFRFAHNIGTIVPAYATALGKTFLSELSEDELDKLYPKENLNPITENTITTKTELKLELEKVRKTGVAFSKEENYVGVWAIAALIRSADSKPIAALSVDLPTFRINQEIIDRLTTLVRMGGSLISFRLGYITPDNQVRDIEDIRSWWLEQPSDSTSQASLATRSH